VVLEFHFRGIPQKAGQHYVFGGLSQVGFSSYVLNEDEIKKIKKELDKADYEDMLQLIEGATTESLDQLKDDINYFLEDKTKEQKEKEKKMSLKDMFQPFSALFGAYNESEPEKKKEEKKEDKRKSIGELFGFKSEKKDEDIIEPDNYIEKTFVRKLAVKEAVDQVFKIFDVYKKSHGMETFP
jgi:hypothetical protein